MGRVLVMGKALLEGTGFLTLTWSDNVLPADGHEAKRLLDAFGKRYKRAFPGGWFIWKEEIKRRKMGACRGLLVPHYHLIVGGHGLSQSGFWGWAIVNWMAVNDNENPDAWLHGVKFRETYGGYRGVSSYLAKYMGKRVEREIAEEYGWHGRCWGIVGRENMPWAVENESEIDQKQAVQLKRLSRAWLKSKGARGYAKKLASQPPEYGYELWGFPDSEASRLVKHACRLAYGGPGLVLVERYSIGDDWEVRLEDVVERWVE
jgi:hypothetical protein